MKKIRWPNLVFDIYNKVATADPKKLGMKVEEYREGS